MAKRRWFQLLQSPRKGHQTPPKNRPPAAPAAWSEPNRMASPPRHQNAFPLHPQKALSCRGPWPDCLQFFTRVALLPPRFVPNCKQTGPESGGASAPPNSFDQESQDCPIQGRANDGRGADAPYFNGVRNEGLILARNASSIVQPVCACQCIARPCFPLRSTLTVLAGPGDFALRISRREFCQEQQPSRSRTNGDGNASTNSRHDA
jgi:hypothetical protein